MRMCISSNSFPSSVAPSKKYDGKDPSVFWLPWSGDGSVSMGCNGARLLRLVLNPLFDMDARVEDDTGTPFS